MRVVAGTARGRRLVAPDGATTRPTSDRVRESVANALASLDAIAGARVLDLFAGSGALAIEALSRGADRAVLVERERVAVRAIEQNLATTGLAPRARVIAQDVDRALAAEGQEYDLVLIDPPYGFDGWDGLLARVDPLLAPEAVVVIESNRAIPLPAGWASLREKRYGDTLVMFAASSAGPSAPPDPTRPPEPPGDSA